MNEYLFESDHLELTIKVLAEKWGIKADSYSVTHEYDDAGWHFKIDSDEPYFKWVIYSLLESCGGTGTKEEPHSSHSMEFDYKYGNVPRERFAKVRELLESVGDTEFIEVVAELKKLTLNVPYSNPASSAAPNFEVTDKLYHFSIMPCIRFATPPDCLKAGLKAEASDELKRGFKHALVAANIKAVRSPFEVHSALGIKVIRRLVADPKRLTKHIEQARQEQIERKLKPRRDKKATER